MTLTNLTSYLRSLLALVPQRICALLLYVSLLTFTACQVTNVTNSNQLSPDDALQRFYNNNGPEETLMDPLIVAGDKVMPLVMREVKNKEMPRRRYAIAFLGNGSYRDAIPVLENILRDTREEDYFRADALTSIYMIDESMGLRLAQQYKDQADYLGDVSRRVLAGDAQLRKRRSYADAIVGMHD